MATQGTIGVFRNAQETWQSYVEGVQQHFVANDVKTTDKQRAVLLSAVGRQTYQLIRNLLAPTKPTEETFAELWQLHKSMSNLARLLLSSGLTFIAGADVMGRISQHTWPNYAKYIGALRNNPQRDAPGSAGVWCRRSTYPAELTQADEAAERNT